MMEAICLIDELEISTILTILLYRKNEEKPVERSPQVT